MKECSYILPKQETIAYMMNACMIIQSSNQQTPYKLSHTHTHSLSQPVCVLCVLCMCSLTHEAAPQGEVVFVAESVDGGQSVQDLLENEHVFSGVSVSLQPAIQVLT